MNQKELQNILGLHELWLKEDPRGKKADFRGADLSEADLSGADLSEADLSGANLSRTNFRGSDLRMANLRGADLSEADLTGAILGGSSLPGLHVTDIFNADLTEAKLPDYKNFPEEGSFIAWKKLDNNHLAKIEIPNDAKRCSNLISKQGRANKIKILDILDEKKNPVTGPVKCWCDESQQTYETGKTYETELNEDIRICCTKGFHFFLTKKEAENWGKYS